MKEINRKALVEALSTLPEYDPPEAVWEALEADLDLQKWYNANGVSPKILPVHTPPESIWKNIQQRIDHPKNPYRVWYRWWPAVAAAVVLLLASRWFFSPSAKQTREETFRISYSTEMQNPLLAQADWDADEDAFQTFLAYCQSEHYLCGQPAFKQLKMELEELTLAKEELKTAMGGFGATPDLVLQMKKIELDRTNLLKKMMVMLI